MCLSIQGGRTFTGPPNVATDACVSVKKRRRKSEGQPALRDVCKGKKKMYHQTRRKATSDEIQAFEGHGIEAISETPASLFKDLVQIPAKIIQPGDLYRILAERNGRKHHDLLPLLTRLFFAIASPDAFDQLREACVNVRQAQAPILMTSANEVLPAMQVLDHLDAATSISSILRRFHLTRLLDRRTILEKSHKNSRSRLITRASNGDKKAGRVDSKALADLMAESYPRLKQPAQDKQASTDAEYRDKLRKLQNRLSCARNWYALQQICSPGILALVPCGGQFHIQIDQ